jgi:hypothetical protein
LHEKNWDGKIPANRGNRFVKIPASRVKQICLVGNPEKSFAHIWLKLHYKNLENKTGIPLKHKYGTIAKQNTQTGKILQIGGAHVML